MWSSYPWSPVLWLMDGVCLTKPSDFVVFVVIHPMCSVQYHFKSTVTPTYLWIKLWNLQRWLLLDIDDFIYLSQPPQHNDSTGIVLYSDNYHFLHSFQVIRIGIFVKAHKVSLHQNRLRTPINRVLERSTEGTDARHFLCYFGEGSFKF